MSDMSHVAIHSAKQEELVVGFLQEIEALGAQGRATVVFGQCCNNCMVLLRNLVCTVLLCMSVCLSEPHSL